MKGFIIVLGILFAIIGVVAAQADPSDAVFQVEVWTSQRGSDGFYHGGTYGTGFFVNSDGTALTNSHVVHEAVHDPDRYRLMAIVGKEFYDARVVCASKLPYDPTQTDPNRVGVKFSKDVAEIKLAPSTFPFSRVMRKVGQDTITRASAHTGSLPEFDFLAVGGTPQGHVRVIGFGRISPIPYKWMTDGNVEKSFTAGDGTEVFRIMFTSPPQKGNSGSPVLNDQNQVVGMWTWHSYEDPRMGTAQNNTVLKAPCP